MHPDACLFASRKSELTHQGLSEASLVEVVYFNNLGALFKDNTSVMHNRTTPIFKRSRYIFMKATIGLLSFIQRHYAIMTHGSLNATEQCMHIQEKTSIGR